METEDNISYYVDSAKHVDFANHRGSAKYSSVLFFSILQSYRHLSGSSVLVLLFCNTAVETTSPWSNGHQHEIKLN